MMRLMKNELYGKMKSLANSYVSLDVNWTTNKKSNTKSGGVDGNLNISCSVSDENAAYRKEAGVN